MPRRSIMQRGRGLWVAAGLFAAVALAAALAAAGGSGDNQSVYGSVYGADAGPSTSPATAPATTSTTTTVPTTTTTTTLPPPALLIEGSPMVRFSVEVADGIDLDRNDLARFVVETLADERSWRGRGVGFELVGEGGLFTIVVATPADVDRMCRPLRTAGHYSCGRNGWVALNSDRWFGATDDWPADLVTYRRYLVNHEIGHYLGEVHVSCPGPGRPAPIMMQQTKGLGECLPNGWVDP